MAAIPRACNTAIEETLLPRHHLIRGRGSTGEARRLFFRQRWRAAAPACSCTNDRLGDVRHCARESKVGGGDVLECVFVRWSLRLLSRVLSRSLEEYLSCRAWRQCTVSLCPWDGARPTTGRGHERIHVSSACFAVVTPHSASRVCKKENK